MSRVCIYFLMQCFLPGLRLASQVYYCVPHADRQALNPFKIQAGFLADTDKLIPKFIGKYKGSRRPETILKKRGKVGGFLLCGFKTYCKAMVTKMVWYWQKGRPGAVEQNCEKYLFTLTFDKNAKIIQWEKSQSFHQWHLYNWVSACKRTGSLPSTVYTVQELKHFIKIFLKGGMSLRYFGLGSVRYSVRSTSDKK